MRPRLSSLFVGVSLSRYLLSSTVCVWAWCATFEHVKAPPCSRLPHTACPELDPLYRASPAVHSMTCCYGIACCPGHHSPLMLSIACCLGHHLLCRSSPAVQVITCCRGHQLLCRASPAVQNVTCFTGHQLLSRALHAVQGTACCPEIQLLSRALPAAQGATCRVQRVTCSASAAAGWWRTAVCAAQGGAASLTQLQCGGGRAARGR